MNAGAYSTPRLRLCPPLVQKVYVAAFGSGKVGVFDVSEIEDADFETNYDPTTESGDYLSTGGGPAGRVTTSSCTRTRL